MRTISFATNIGSQLCHQAAIVTSAIPFHWDENELLPMHSLSKMHLSKQPLALENDHASTANQETIPNPERRESSQS